MKFFYPSRAYTFFDRHGINNLFQEASSVLIGITAGFYSFEKREEFLGLLGMPEGRPFEMRWPGSWTTPKNINFFHTCLYIFIAIVIIKLLIYLRILDLDRLFGYKSKRKTWIDLNGILQEILTIIIGITIGIFSAPITKTSWFGLSSSEQFVNPKPGIITVVVCLLLKLFINAKALNPNAMFFRNGKVFQPWETSNYLQKADWNNTMKEVLSTLIGIGVGLYLYESNLIFLPGQFIEKASDVLSGINETIATPGREIGRTVGVSKVTDPIFDITNEATKITKDISKIQWVPDMTEHDKKYWTIGLIVVIVCLIFKILMYNRRFNFNELRNAIFGKRGRAELPSADRNEVIDEINMFLLTSLLGVMIDPLFANLKGMKTPYPYGYLSLVILIILTLIKIGFILDVLDFNPRSARKRR